jgi:hypothetical protein
MNESGEKAPSKEKMREVGRSIDADTLLEALKSPPGSARRRNAGNIIRRWVGDFAKGEGDPNERAAARIKSMQPDWRNEDGSDAKAREVWEVYRGINRDEYVSEQSTIPSQTTPRSVWSNEEIKRGYQIAIDAVVAKWAPKSDGADKIPMSTFVDWVTEEKEDSTRDAVNMYLNYHPELVPVWVEANIEDEILLERRLSAAQKILEGAHATEKTLSQNMFVRLLAESCGVKFKAAEGYFYNHKSEFETLESWERVIKKGRSESLSPEDSENCFKLADQVLQAASLKSETLSLVELARRVAVLDTTNTLTWEKIRDHINYRRHEFKTRFGPLWRKVVSFRGK